MTDSDGRKTVVVTRVVKKKEAEVIPIEWDRVYPGALQAAAVSAVLGMMVYRWRGKGPLLFAASGLYAGLTSFSYLYVREVVRTEQLPPVPVANIGFVGGAFAGALLGLVLPAANGRVRFQRMATVGFVGAIVGSIGAVAHDYYLKWTEINAERKRKLTEKREKRFLEDKEKLGDRAYDLQRKDTASRMPSWWPIRAVTDEEYEEMLEKKAKVLERQILKRQIEEREERERLEAAHTAARSRSDSESPTSPPPPPASSPSPSK